jgi:transglutaminase-like putative cysteine protease
LASSLKISPWPAVAREHRDFFGNRVSYFSAQQSHSVLEVRASSEVGVTRPAPLKPAHTLPWEQALTRVHEEPTGGALAERLFGLPSPGITTAIGRDYHDVTPVRGVFYGGGEHDLSVAVDVDRLYD